MKDITKIFAVIDTNVIVSALFSRDGTSNPARVIGAMLSGTITPLYNDGILAEYRSVLCRPKFPFDEILIDTVVSSVQDFGLNTTRTTTIDEVFPDPDDIVFYEVKMSVDDAFLVTGNIKHFPKKPFVVTPAEMVEILKKKGLI
jgi:predicted nucleic acid-binding protein